jgi:hypothetical protein
MFSKFLALILILLIPLNTWVCAQDEDFQSAVDYKVDKMKRELRLTDTQAEAIRPVIKDYWTKKEALLQDVAGQGIVDHVSVKNSLKALRDDEHQKLSKILTADQMKQWIDKENLMATLNPDGGENAVDDDVSMTANGANFKF